MLHKIAQEIKAVLQQFPQEDQIIFGRRAFPLDRKNFHLLSASGSSSTFAFVDGGQAEILSAGNFCLSFIRVFAQFFQGEKKSGSEKREFYLFTRAKKQQEELFYESKIYPLAGEKLISEEDLLLSSYDPSLRVGLERAPLAKIAQLARRFAELALAAQVKADYVLLDGTLEQAYTHEEKYLHPLLSSGKAGAIAKTSSLFTSSGNSPVVLLNQIGPKGCWQYFLSERTQLVKLQEQSRHILRFEGPSTILPFLIPQCQDVLFLGYPYGLILADKFARVSNEEKNSLRMNFLLRAENREILQYLHSTDAHEILDRMG